MKAKDLEERLLDTKKIYEQIEIPAELNERMRLALGEMSKETEQKDEKVEVIQTRRDEKSQAVICQDKNNIERYTFSYVSKRQKHPPKPCKSYF